MDNSSSIGKQSLIIKICFRFQILQFSSFVVLDSLDIYQYIVKERNHKICIIYTTQWQKCMFNLQNYRESDDNHHCDHATSVNSPLILQTLWWKIVNIPKQSKYHWNASIVLGACVNSISIIPFSINLIKKIKLYIYKYILISLIT